MAKRGYVYFAGLARDCANDLPKNLQALITLALSNHDYECQFFFLENDSQDQTREVLNATQCLFPDRIRIWQFPGLAAAKPERIERISWCRNFLLDQIRDAAESFAVNTIYVPVDLDASIAVSLCPEGFWRAVDCLMNSQMNGIFPISQPFYYDLLALRCVGWLEADYRELVVASRSLLGSAKALERHAFSLQYSPQDFGNAHLIQVESAFGGVGLYRFMAIKNCYYQTGWLGHFFECEHVSFNRQVGQLAIDCKWLVQAPPEHIAYQLMGAWRRSCFWVGCAIKDCVRRFMLISGSIHRHIYKYLSRLAG
jgi:hypothetical protein